MAKAAVPGQFSQQCSLFQNISTESGRISANKVTVLLPFRNPELSGILVAECARKVSGYRRLDVSLENEGGVLLVTLEQMLEKQKTWRHALKFTAELSERMRVFCCKFCS